SNNLLIVLLSTRPTSVRFTLSLHDALPIFVERDRVAVDVGQERDTHHAGIIGARSGSRKPCPGQRCPRTAIIRPPIVGTIAPRRDRKSTRLNSSHLGISYAVFCLKKKSNR